MSTRFTYMGTKHQLSPLIQEAMADLPSGRMLDAFAGMGSVAEQVGQKRGIWTNDVQKFAAMVTHCKFCSTTRSKSAKFFVRVGQPIFEQNFEKLAGQNRELLKLEDRFLYSDSALEASVLWSEAEAIQVNGTGAFSCLSECYSVGYFSTKQAFEADSIRRLLDTLRGFGDLNDEQWAWGLVALGKSLLRVANTTGHFAQYLKPNTRNLGRIQKQFQRSVWREWLYDVAELRPFGTKKWRSQNFSTNKTATDLFSDDVFLADTSIVYCDPPYTNDQYSRYYHVWETLVEYDYPEISGIGRYRSDRFTADFSHKRSVKEAFENLIKSISKKSCHFVLSYPSNGLLYQVGHDPLEIIQSHFSKAKLYRALTYNHSTMGASKGAAKSIVEERIFVANP